MKTITKNPDALKSICKQVCKEYKADARVAQEALTAMVRAAMSYDVSEPKAQEAVSAVEREFVDLNELRVATELEIQELVGAKIPDIEARVTLLTQSLYSVFEKEHTMSLERLKTVSRRDARQYLRELPNMTPFVEAYMMLFAFDGHAMPVDDTILNFLRDAGVFDETATIEEAQKFVEHQLKAEECYEFYFALRRACYDEGRSKKKK